MRSNTDQKIRQLKEEYAAIAELRNPALEIQLVRAVMTYKVNHVLRARKRTALADLIRRRDDLQVKALMNTAEHAVLPSRRHGVERGITAHP